MSAAAKPCPWCHGTDIRLHSLNAPEWPVDERRMFCMGCGASGPTVVGTQAQALAVWNQRGKPEPASDVDPKFNCKACGHLHIRHEYFAGRYECQVAGCTCINGISRQPSAAEQSELCTCTRLRNSEGGVMLVGDVLCPIHSKRK